MADDSRLQVRSNSSDPYNWEDVGHGASDQVVPVGGKDGDPIEVTGSVTIDTSGLATEAKQDTLIGHVDGIETLLTTIESNQLSDGHNVTVDNPGDIGGGTQYDEGDDISTTPTGTLAMVRDGSNQAEPLIQPTTPSDTQPVSNAALTELAAAINSNELDINIASDSVGIGGGTQYTEDEAAAADPVGNALIMVRDDSLSGQTTTDGDNVAVRGTDKGELYVKHVDTITVDLGANNDVTLATLPDTSSGDLAAITTATEAIQSAVEGTLTVDGSGVTQPVSGTVTANLSATDNAVLDQIELNTDDLLTTTDFNAAFGTAGSADSQVLSVQGISSMTPLLVDATGQGDVPVTLDSEAVVLGAGTAEIGKLAANSGVDIGDVDVTSVSAGSNLIGDVGIQGRASGGLSTFYDSDLDETAVAVKAGAGTVYAIEAFNTTDAPLFLQLFNVAQGSVTVGSTTPKNQWVIPGNADSDGSGFTFNVPQGIDYDTAITAACSTDSEGNSAPGSGACIVNIHYK